MEHKRVNQLKHIPPKNRGNNAANRTTGKETHRSSDNLSTVIRKQLIIQKSNFIYIYDSKI